MNIPHNSLTSAFLAVSILISGLSADLAGAQDTSASEATIQKHGKVAASSLPPAEIPRSKYLRFGRITAKDGLSSVDVKQVYQDKRGFIWIGTLGGLHRYDGSGTKEYRNDPDDPNSFGGTLARAFVEDKSGNLWIGCSSGVNRYDWDTDTFIRYEHDPDDPHSFNAKGGIRTLIEDQDGMIWVGTLGGLNKFDPESGKFTIFLHDPDDPNSLSNNVIWSIVEDGTGVLWIGTEDGLNRFDPDTETFFRYQHDPDDPTSLPHNLVRSIYEDHSGVIWVGTDSGLGKLNPEGTHFTNYQHDADDPQSLSNNVISTLLGDRSGSLWVGTYGSGLDRFDPDTGTFTHYRNSKDDPYSLSNDTIWHIFKGQQEMVLIATEGGVSFLDGNAKPFHHYRIISDNPNNLRHNNVSALHADRAGIVWVGTNNGGFYKFDRQAEAFTQYLNSPSDPVKIGDVSVTDIHKDTKGLIWIGTRGTGLIKFDPDTEHATTYKFDNANPHSLSHDWITRIHEDKAGTIWITTYGGGVNSLDRETEHFTRYQHDPKNPHSPKSISAIVTSVVEDQAGALWFATIGGGGFAKLNRETGEFTHFRLGSSDPTKRVNNSMGSLYVDRTGNLWVGTLGGLGKVDPQTNQMIGHYTVKDGLPTNSVAGVLEGENGQLWISTVSGLSRFDPRTESFRNYTESDGLQSNGFSWYGAYAKSQDGEMFFGGPNGFNAFYPDQIKDNLTPPPVMITDFQLAIQPVPIGGDSVLQKSILETDELVLSYQDNILSFEFAALNYGDPEGTRYKYRMEGFEKGWKEVDSTRRFVTYTNFDPGDYIFRVIAANSDGIWNEEGASIRLTVTPPWWETLWFRSIMVVIATGLLVGGFRWRVRATEARSRELETQVRRRTAELEVANKEALEARNAAEVANQAKSEFLSNMSHELRTPLNAILGFSTMLVRVQNTSADQQEKLSIIYRSGQHLLAMINDVLDLSKIEAGRAELKEIPFDLDALITEVGVMIQSRATEKGLSVAVENDKIPFPYVKADIGKLRQILINLLGNAVKFTDDGGVTIRCSSEPIPEEPKQCRILIEVEDTGPGIDPDRQATIFDPFVQEDNVAKRKGTGLGLSISKRFADIMGGTIEVESEVGTGSLFRVRLPAEIAEATDIRTPFGDRPRVVGLAPAEKTWRVLIADDNRDNLLLLKSLLEEVGFLVRKAQNGKEALEAFKMETPDFIWMDMRMPVMDGYEATRHIRQCSGGDKVPIVAITASAFREQRHEIMAAGCNDIVPKPFQTDEIFEAMGRFLDIEYIYEPESEAAPARMDGADLTSEMLADLPRDLLQELRKTIATLDRGAISACIDHIDPLAPDTAKALKSLVDNFQMTKLLNLLGEVNGNADKP